MCDRNCCKHHFLNQVDYKNALRNDCCPPPHPPICSDPFCSCDYGIRTPCGSFCLKTDGKCCRFELEFDKKCGKPPFCGK